jgi:HK97 family phage major capsid protein
MNIAELRAAYDAAVARLHECRDAITGAGEDADVEALETALTDAADEAERTKGNLQRAERVQRVIDENPREAAAGEPARTPVRVVNEPLTYREHGPNSFFADSFRAEKRGDFKARERLERHMQEMEVEGFAARERDGQEQRDVGTGAFAGLTVPQYLIDLYAPLARAGSPLLNAVRKLPLPDRGMTVNISRITTGTAAAAQASENDAVQETNIDDTLLTVNVRTYAGQQDVSRQALERSELVDVVVFGDLIADYFTKLDDAILNADGTSGTHLGIRSTGSIVSVAYTDGSPTVPELYPKGADAVQQIETNRYMPPMLWVMHPRRWAWMLAALDTTNRPLVVPNANGPFNALAVGQAVEYGQIVGTWHGLPVLTDANLPTNAGAGTEDVIIATRTPDLLFWQDGDGSPRQFTFEQANAPQSIRLAVWGYSAFTAGRYPKASATIGGTGLAAPTF